MCIRDRGETTQLPDGATDSLGLPGIGLTFDDGVDE